MRALDLPAPPWVIGHRGAAAEVLENTTESVRRAFEAGSDMVEIDVRLTADGTLVVFHDATLERLAGRAVTVERTRWPDLRSVELRAPGGSATYRIPRLADLLSAVPEDHPLNLEIKIDEAPAEVLASRLAGELGQRRQVLVSSFDWAFLSVAGRLAPGLPLAPISGDDRAGLLAAGRELGAWSLHCRHPLATRRLLEAPERQKRPVLAYTVNEPRRARTLLRRGVSGVFTDAPTRLVRNLRRWPA